MTATIKSMHAGQGVDYLLRTVAVGDGDRSLLDPLTRYYAEEGTPPGYWLGSGIASLDSELKVGDAVAEEHLRRLIGHGSTRSRASNSAPASAPTVSPRRASAGTQWPAST